MDNPDEKKLKIFDLVASEGDSYTFKNMKAIRQVSKLLDAGENFLIRHDDGDVELIIASNMVSSVKVGEFKLYAKTEESE